MKVLYEKSFLRDIKKVKNQKLLNSLTNTIEDIKSADEMFSLSNIRKLKGHPAAYSIRINDFRLGLFYDNNTAIITRFLNRKDIYKFFP